MVWIEGFGWQTLSGGVFVFVFLSLMGNLIFLLNYCFDFFSWRMEFLHNSSPTFGSVGVSDERQYFVI